MEHSIKRREHVLYVHYAKPVEPEKSAHNENKDDYQKDKRFSQRFLKRHFLPRPYVSHSSRRLPSVY